MTPSEIELATFRFVAQHFNHCATAVPIQKCRKVNMYRTINIFVFMHGCETWCVILTVFEKRVMKRIFEPERNDVNIVLQETG